MDAWQILGRIILLLTVAAGLGVALRRLGQNAVVGYLLAGVLLGPTGLRVFRGGDELGLLGELGVALLLFSVGLEFSYRRLRQIGRVASLGGSLQILVTAALAAPALLASGLPPAEALVIGAAIAMSSTAVVVRILMDRAELDSVHGRAAVGILLLQDIAVVPLLLAAETLAKGAGGFQALAGFGARAAGAAALALALWLAIRYVVKAAFGRALLSGQRELPVILAACTSIGAAYGAHAMGLSPVLGAFVAGLLLAESPFALQIRADLTPLTAVFVALFFGSVGTVTSLPGGGRLFQVVLLTLGVMALKALVAGAVVWFFQRSLRAAVAVGLTISQVGEFTFIIAGLAHRYRIIPADHFQVLVSVSILTLIATPYLIAAASGSGAWILRRFPRRRRRLVETPAARRQWDRVLVVGFGPAGQRVVDALREAGIPFLVIEFNPNTVRTHQPLLPIELGDATQPEVLQNAGIGGARALVVTVPDPSTSRLIAGQAVGLAPSVPVIVRSRYHQYAPMLAATGAASTVDEEEIVGAEMAREILRCAKKRGAAPVL